MRVLLTTDFYPPFIGGTERQVQLLAAALSARNHDVTVATVWHAGLAEEEREGRVLVRRLRSSVLEQPFLSSDPVRRFHPPLPVPGIVNGLRSIIGDLRPDVVNANGWIAYSSTAALIGTETPLVVSVRDYGYSCATRTLMHFDRRICSGPAIGKCLRCATHRYGAAKAIASVFGVAGGRVLLTRHVRAIHVVSKYVRSIVKRDLVADDDLGWNPPIVRIPDIPPSPQPEGEASEAPVVGLPTEPFILFVGQLTAHKGIYWLLDAYRGLDKPPPLVLIGTAWPDTPKVLPPGVVLIGEAPHEVVLQAWRRSLFGVAPSIWPDPLPGVVREAMSQGKPVVGAAVGGIPDMVEHLRTGLLVEPGDVKGLREAIECLATDRELRARLGAAAQTATQQITEESVAVAFEELYDSAILRVADGNDR